MNDYHCPCCTKPCGGGTEPGGGGGPSAENEKERKGSTKSAKRAKDETYWLLVVHKDDRERIELQGFQVEEHEEELVEVASREK